MCEICNDTGYFLPYGNLGEPDLNYFQRERCYLCDNEEEENEDK